MLKRISGLLLIIVMFLTIFPLSSIMEGQHQDIEGMKIQQGVLDLADWDYKENPILTLDGQWAFYWNQLLLPEEAHERLESAPVAPYYMEVPSPWNGEGISPFPAKGFATYRLLLRNIPDAELFALKKANIRFSSEIFVNGTPLMKDGEPAAHKDDYEPGNYPQMGLFSVENGDAEIVIHVANYDYVNGGVSLSLTFGEHTAMIERQQKIEAREFVGLSMLFSLSLIYLVFFTVSLLYRAKDYTLLLCAIFCFLYTIYYGWVGERTLLLFMPSLSFEILYKLKDWISLAGIVVLCMLFYQLDRNLLSLKILRPFIAVFLLFMVVLPFMSIGTYSKLYALPIVIYHVLLLWLLFRSALLYIQSDREQRWKPLLFFMAVLTITLYSIDVVLFAISLKTHLLAGQLYLLLFNFVMLILIVLRFVESYRTMHKMQNRLIAMDQLKDEFLSNISYELKNPLTSIIHIAETLHQGVAGPVTKEQAHNLSVIYYSGQGLVHMVNELMDYSKLQHNDLRLSLTAVHLASTVDAVLEINRYLAADKTIKLSNQIRPSFPVVHADQNRLMQILHHFIADMIRSGHKHIEVRALATYFNARIEIVVMDANHQPSASTNEEDTAYPAVESNQSMGNEPENGLDDTALGLRVVQKLIELHGGEFQPGKPGSKREPSVSFTIALATPDQIHFKFTDAISKKAAPANPRLPTNQYPHHIAGSRNQSIMIANHDMASLQSLTNLLVINQYPLVLVNRGQMVLDEINSRPDVSLVLLDISLPDMTGFETLRKIRERYSPLELPVLMLTSRTMISELKLAIESGANDFVSKPFEEEELMARVSNLLNLKETAKTAKDVEIAFLRSQIKPHFLYNSLNAIAELCIDNPEQAEELTLHLAQYLRNSFDFKPLDSFVTLEKELRLIEAYVAIEQARFGSRLQVDYFIQADPGLLIPPLILQPLVENGILHGLMSTAEGGKINVTVLDKGNQAYFEVADNGSGIDPDRLARMLQSDSDINGVGFKNIRQRLKLLYGETLYVESELGEGTRVSFQLPKTLLP